MDHKIIALSFVFFAVLCFVDGACTFRSALHGDWVTDTDGNMTINSTFITFEVATFGVFDLECTEQNGSVFLVKGDSVGTRHGTTLDALLCFEFQMLTTASFLYWRPQAEDSTSGNAKQYLLSAALSKTFSEICTVSKPYDDLSYGIAVKSSSFSDAAVPCPYYFQSSMSYVYDYGGANTCDGTGILNVCKSTDTVGSAIVFDYNNCSTQMFYSASGSLTCLHYSTIGNLTYLSLYNNDDSTDESNTYRFSCLAYTPDATTLTTLGTQNPKMCTTTQTATTVSSPGVVLKFQGSTQTNCYGEKDNSSSASKFGARSDFVVAVMTTIFFLFYCLCL